MVAVVEMREQRVVQVIFVHCGVMPVEVEVPSSSSNENDLGQGQFVSSCQTLQPLVVESADAVSVSLFTSSRRSHSPVYAMMLQHRCSPHRRGMKANI